MKKIILSLLLYVLLCGISFAGPIESSDGGSGGGSIATDTIWDAAGDTVYGTGSDTAARLAKGTAYQLYMMNAGATAPVWTSTLGATGTRLTKGWFTDLEVTNAIAGSTTGNILNSILVAKGDLLTASAAATPAVITDVAAGSPLLSGGIGELPAYAAWTQAAPGAVYALLASDGTNWTRLATSSDVQTMLGSANNAAILSNIGAAAYDALLASLAGLTVTAGDIIYFTASDTAAVLDAGTANYILGMNSGGTAPEWKSSLSIASIDMTSSTSSIPWPVSESAPGTFNVNGMSWYDSNGYQLVIRDQTNTRNLTFVPEGIATGGLIFGDSSPDAAGEIGYDGALKYYNTAARTVVSLDESQTLTNKTLTTPIITSLEVLIDCNGSEDPYTYCTSANASTLTATQTSRTIINSYGRGEAQTVTLPTAATGMTFIAMVGTQHNSAWKIQRAGSDTITWSTGGTDTAGKTYFQETNQAVGSRVSCITYKTGASAWTWLCGSVTGTWVTD